MSVPHYEVYFVMNFYLLLFNDMKEACTVQSVIIELEIFFIHIAIVKCIKQQFMVKR